MREKKKEDEQKANDLEALQRYWTDPNLTQDEKFLRDYVLERAWVEKDKDKLPTYDEIVDAEDSDDLEQMEEFERKYNFRHEEE
jgi:protein KRI1